MLAAAAVVLPGAAFVVSAEKAGLSESGLRVSDSPARGERPQRNARTESRLESAGISSQFERYWVTYEVAGVLARIERGEIGRDEAKMELMKLCGFNDDGNCRRGSESRIVWKDELLAAVATEAEHETIRAELEAIREYGLCSLEIEVLCIQGPAAEIRAILESEGPLAEPLLKEQRDREATEGHFTCGSLVAHMDLEQVMRQSKANRAVRVLASPRLRVQAGQTATVRIGEEIPVGSAEAKESAAVRHVPVGLEMQFQPRLRAGNKVLLYSDVTLSEAVRVESQTHSEGTSWRASGIRVVSHKASSTTFGPLGDTIAIHTQGAADDKEDSEQTLFLVRVEKSEAGPPTAKRQSAVQPAWDLLGLQLEAIDEDEFHRDFNTHYRGGLRVTKVRPDSQAVEQGLRVGDILVGLHNWETRSLKNLDFVLSRADLEELSPLKYYILRGDDALYGYIRVAKPPETGNHRTANGLVAKTYPVADLVLLRNPISIQPMSKRASTSRPKARMPLPPRPSNEPAPAPLPPSLAAQEDRPSGLDSLISLITSTIAPAMWDKAGGSGNITASEPNLSLEIRQTEDVHNEIADLLTRLRRPLEVQVVLRIRTVEVSREFREQHWPEMSEKSHSTVMTAGAVETLLKRVRSAPSAESGRVGEGPKVTLFNGQ